jgi:hypothetical protein
MTRRRQLAAVHQDLLDIFGDEIGRPVVAMLDVVAAHEDERDDLIGRALHIEACEWQAET